MTYWRTIATIMLISHWLKANGFKLLFNKVTDKTLSHSPINIYIHKTTIRSRSKLKHRIRAAQGPTEGHQTPRMI